MAEFRDKAPLKENNNSGQAVGFHREDRGVQVLHWNQPGVLR